MLFFQPSPPPPPAALDQDVPCDDEPAPMHTTQTVVTPGGQVHELVPEPKPYKAWPTGLELELEPEPVLELPVAEIKESELDVNCMFISLL